MACSDINSLVDFLGGEIEVARICEVHQTTVSTWKKNNRIPSWYWPKLIEAGKGKISADTLLKISTSNTSNVP